MTDITSSPQGEQTLEEPGEQTPTNEHQQSPGAAAPGDAARNFGEAFAQGAEQAAGDGGAAEVEEDLDELVKTAKQRDEYLALAQRTQADFENFRKRVAKEGAAAQERGAIALAKELLPALDNLDRAIGEFGADAASSPEGEGVGRHDPLLQGVKLVRSELNAALARAGIESFSPRGEQFDPALHEAVATAPQEGGNGKPSGTVVEVYQAGYRCRDSVIRPARVVVAA